MTHISEDEIRTYGQKARSNYATVTNNCGDIIDDFEGYLNDYCDLPWRGDAVNHYGRREVRAGPNGENKHYVFHIDGRFLDDYEDGETIVIDLSFDQFNDANLEAEDVNVSFGPASALTTEQIRIMPPGDPRLDDYQSIAEFFENTG